MKSVYREHIKRHIPEFTEIFDQVIIRQQRDEACIKKWKAVSQEASFFLITLPLEEILDYKETDIEPIEYAAIYESVSYSVCKEPIIKAKALHINDHFVCIPCSKREFFQIDGSGIHKNK